MTTMRDFELKMIRGGSRAALKRMRASRNLHAAGTAALAGAAVAHATHMPGPAAMGTAVGLLNRTVAGGKMGRRLSWATSPMLAAGDMGVGVMRRNRAAKYLKARVARGA